MSSKPFIKWVGGKRNLLPQILPHLPTEYKHYYEPFLGGGAVFWELSKKGTYPHYATLSDSNLDLIIAYREVRDRPGMLLARLSEMENTKEFFLQVRAKVPQDLTERAARFIYLNKTAFNGLWRVNKRGEFNVPYGGYKNPAICDQETILACSEVLQGVGIQHKQWWEIPPQPGDLVYLDPPYVPLKPTSNFTSYTKDGFGEEEQRFLAKKYSEWVESGVHCVLSNSDTPLIRELYEAHQIVPVQAKRAVAAKAVGRGTVQELLILPRG